MRVVRSNLLRDRLLAVAVGLQARRVLSRFLADARNATATQHRVLMSHIRANADSAYGVEHDFGSIRTYEDFVRRVPISNYSDLAPWVERVKRGDVRAMFGGRQRVRMFAMTSGTVDKPKYIPVTNRFLKDLRAGWNAFGIKALTDHPDCFARPIVQVTSPMDEQRTSGGYPCGAITGLMAATQKKLVLRYYVAPLCVANICDTLAKRYTIMRLAMPADVAWIVTASPATVLQLAKTGEENAESIIRDVYEGTLSAAMSIPGTIREALAPRLLADRVAGRRLQRILDQHGTLRPKDYWSLGFLANWTGGTMGLYLREFPKYFGDTPVRDIGLLATEGRLSIPVEDGTPAGIAAVSGVFLEFIPAAERSLGVSTDCNPWASGKNPTVLRSHQVEVGQEYFILLTNSAGFYRYDISDCVRVVGFEGQAPIIEFLHKGDHVSSIAGEKITERQVVMAFGRAWAEVGGCPSDFVLAPQWSDPPFYRLYVEDPLDGGEHWSLRLGSACDEHLGRLNIEYASKRSSSRLGAIVVVVVGGGVLQSLDHRRASRYRRSNEQFKHQYLYTRPAEDEELSACGCEKDRLLKGGVEPCHQEIGTR